MKCKEQKEQKFLVVKFDESVDMIMMLCKLDDACYFLPTHDSALFPTSPFLLLPSSPLLFARWGKAPKMLWALRSCLVRIPTTGDICTTT